MISRRQIIEIQQADVDLGENRGCQQRAVANNRMRRTTTWKPEESGWRNGSYIKSVDTSKGWDEAQFSDGYEEAATMSDREFLEDALDFSADKFADRGEQKTKRQLKQLQASGQRVPRDQFQAEQQERQVNERRNNSRPMEAPDSNMIGGAQEMTVNRIFDPYSVYGEDEDEEEDVWYSEEKLFEVSEEGGPRMVYAPLSRVLICP